MHTTGCVRTVLDLAAACMACGLYSRHPLDACADRAACCLHVVACRAWAQVEPDVRPGRMGAWLHCTGSPLVWLAARVHTPMFVVGRKCASVAPVHDVVHGTLRCGGWHVAHVCELQEPT